MNCKCNNPAESGSNDFNFDVFFETQADSDNSTNPTVSGYEYLNNTFTAVLLHQIQKMILNLQVLLVD